MLPELKDRNSWKKLELLQEHVWQELGLCVRRVWQELKSWRRCNLCRRRKTILLDLLLLLCSLSSSVFLHWIYLESNGQGNLNDVLCRPHFSASVRSPWPLHACSPYNPTLGGPEKGSHFAFPSDLNIPQFCFGSQFRKHFSRKSILVPPNWIRCP